MTPEDITTSPLVQTTLLQAELGLDINPAVEFDTSDSRWLIVCDDDQDTYEDVRADTTAMLAAATYLGANEVLMVYQVLIADDDSQPGPDLTEDPTAHPGLFFIKMVDGVMRRNWECRYRINDTGKLEWEYTESDHLCEDCGSAIARMIAAYEAIHDGLALAAQLHRANGADLRLTALETIKNHHLSYAEIPNKEDT